MSKKEKPKNNRRALPEDYLITPLLMRDTCRKCGFFRARGQICLQCAVNGEYKTHHVTSRTMRGVIKLAQVLPDDDPEMDMLKHQLMATFPKGKRDATKDGRTVGQLSATSKRLLRAKQLKLCGVIFRLFIRCFERDEYGQWQLYADQLDTLRPLLDVIESVEPDMSRNTASQIPASVEKVGSMRAVGRLRARKPNARRKIVKKR